MSDIKRRSKRVNPDETKRRLLDSGLELFALHGFKAVTTRQLANHAGVNQAAIPYHFGGKEGLYLAVAKRIVATMDQLLTQVQGQAGLEVPVASAPRPELARLLVTLVATLTGRMSVNREMNYQRAFIIREYAMPGKGYDIIYNGGVERLHRLMTEVVAVAMDLDPDGEEAIVYAHTVMGQVMGFAAGKAVLCSRLGTADYDDALGGRIAGIVSNMALRATGLDKDYDPEQSQGDS